MKILIDNGHGKETPGKRSPVWPDGSQLYEYEFNRDIARRVYAVLTARGVDCELIVSEICDISLAERVRRDRASCRPKQLSVGINTCERGRRYRLGSVDIHRTDRSRQLCDDLLRGSRPRISREADAQRHDRRRPGQRGKFLHSQAHVLSDGLNRKFLHGHEG